MTWLRLKMASTLVVSLRVNMISGRIVPRIYVTLVVVLNLMVSGLNVVWNMVASGLNVAWNLVASGLDVAWNLVVSGQVMTSLLQGWTWRLGEVGATR